MTLSLAVETLLAVLLSAVIYYGIVLSRRLAVLRRNEQEMTAKLEAFNAAVATAESSLAGVREIAPMAAAAAEKMGEDSGRLLERAAALRNELAFLVDRGDALADRLETTAHAVRNETRRDPAGAAVPSSAGLRAAVSGAGKERAATVPQPGRPAGKRDAGAESGLAPRSHNAQSNGGGRHIE